MTTEREPNESHPAPGSDSAIVIPSSRHPLNPSSSSPSSRHFHLPREGRLWLATAAILLVIGLFKGINLLLLLACCLLALWCLNALLAGRRLGALTGQRVVDGPVFAQTPFDVRLRIANHGEASVPGLRLEDLGPGHAFARFAPRLGGGEVLLHQETLTLPRRGRYRWGPLQASSGYPFGLVRCSMELVPGEDLLVLPQLGRLHRGRLRQYLTPVGFYCAHSRGASRRHPSAQAEFHGLRGFRTGDSPRWIHWRTSARCGELMIREYEDVPNDNLILVVDPEQPRERGAAAVDALVSLAATVCWEWCRQKGDRLILIAAGEAIEVLDGLTSPEHAQRILECLAALTGQPPASARALLEQIGTLSLPSAPLLLLSAQPSDLGDRIAQQLGQPVAALDVTALAEIDFYEPPCSPATRKRIW